MAATANDKRYAATVAGPIRDDLFQFAGREPSDHVRIKMLNMYMVMYGIDNSHFTSSEEVVMQNIFDSITVSP